VRWALLDWQADGSGPGVYRVGGSAPPADPAGPTVRVQQNGTLLTVDTGVARFALAPGTAFPFQSVLVRGERAVEEARTGFAAEDEAGQVYRPRIDRLHVEAPGPVRALVRLQGALTGPGPEPLTDLDAVLHFFAGSAVVRVDLVLRNPRKADHPGGLWGLGNGGSVYVRDAALTIALPPGEGRSRLRGSPELEAPFEDVAAPFELYQDSSGGENWRSSNHVNRRREVPNTFRGYRLRAGGGERPGLRATPALALTRGGRALGVAMPWFWQNFPKAVEGGADALALRLFPRQYADVHELQGGEQKTHTFYLLFDGPAEAALLWCRAPAQASASPEWYCSTGAVPYLTPRAQDPNADYLALVDAALEGPDTFEHKREVIDEYGWRHFGDVYGDHEAVFHSGPAPLVSHYNNQYDPIAGFGYQYLRSGDPRWFRHMDELAAHVIDIDTYHTDRDKSAYNHGLFWHTYHYVDADTATHRSYPRHGLIAAGPAPGAGEAAGRDDPGADLPWSPRKGRVIGGGPAGEQNYTTGLMLHYFLTGGAASRDAVLELAQWVIDMDDGRKTVFRWLAGGDTGQASSSGHPLYHGPGRGAANSINALLDAHCLTGGPHFLAKAEQLIRRCIHPADDLAARRLLDAERRWYYTMFLQALGRYLDYQGERGELVGPYAYARASLLHYARWMAEHEAPYLDKPEHLEYPTETWAAQDMRKSEVFKFAAKHAAGEERARFLERAEFFFRYSVAALRGMKTRTLARPVVLLLSYGYMHAFFQHHPGAAAPPPAPGHTDFGRPEVFIPQKVRALRRLKALAAAGLGAVALGAAYAVSRLVR
jgi:hypothetical protein